MDRSIARIIPVRGLTLLIAVSATPGLPAGAESDRLPQGAYRVRPAKITDGDTTAYSLFIPAGWQTQGQIVWQNTMAKCGPNATHVNWATSSPDGTQVLHIFPEETWSASSLQAMGGDTECPNVNITQVRDYLQWYVQRNRPEARLLDYRDRPDIIADAQHLNNTQRTGDSETRTWIEAGEVLLGYELRGRETRETIAIAVYFLHNRMPDGRGGVMEFLTVAANAGLAARAPHGQLDFQLIEAVRSSIKANPQWTAMMADHQNKMNAIAMKGNQERHAIRMDTIRAVGEINNQIYAERSASSDRVQERTIQTIREVGPFTDPTTREAFALPATHENAWRLDDGTYVLTDDANFHPYRDLGVDGRQLEPRR